jgi:hypothetical protein
VHCQIHESPSTVTAVGVPALHRLAVGAALKVPPLAEPQAPFVAVPELDPEPDELELEPELELPGDVELIPHWAVVPPFTPAQFQLQGPAPEIAVTLPPAHN